ncbi:endonuclease/exonuclease/phosphatase family protein [Nonomuraea sp. NPDC050556]|uniref:endonuclease/exonuclease/phosphatase family protein n=1 Tax=Nonomuraea sp. NPDC050556 TaxID=3364369 RepID=UPI0037AED027
MITGMAFNIAQAVGQDNVEDLDRIAALIEGADVVGLPRTPNGYRELLEAHTAGLTVFVTHPTAEEPHLRAPQLDAVRAVVGDPRTPTILMGDLNEPASTCGLTDAAAGPTYPSEAPVERLDYVLAGGGLEVVEARIVATDASDHLPLMVTLSPSEWASPSW